MQYAGMQYVNMQNVNANMHASIAVCHAMDKHAFTNMQYAGMQDVNVQP